jgi:hypothetical protein
MPIVAPLRASIAPSRAPLLLQIIAAQMRLQNRRPLSTRAVPEIDDYCYTPFDGGTTLTPKLTLLGLTILACVSPCYAVHWTSSQTGPATWTYTLQIDPQDNYDISQSSTTITMTGLSGVTAAGPPTSSDFPNPIGTNILAWTPQVLNGGTKVVWTISSGGTGNFGSVQHVFGFTITAPGAVNGTASFVTSGFQVDSGGPNRDISGTVAGPTAAGSPPPVPVTTPGGLLFLCVALALAGAWSLRSPRLSRSN